MLDTTRIKYQQISPGWNATSGTRRHSRWYANRPIILLVFLHKKYIFTAIVFTYRGQILAFLCTSQLLFQKWSLKCLAAILFMGICAKSGFPNFWSSDLCQVEFSWHKMLRGDSTGSTNCTRSEKGWEPLLKEQWYLGLKKTLGRVTAPTKRWETCKEIVRQQL